MTGTDQIRNLGRMVAVVMASCGIATTGGAEGVVAARPHRPGSVLLGFEPGTSTAEQRAIEARVPGERVERLLSAEDVRGAERTAPGPAAADRISAVGPLIRLVVPGGGERRVAERLERLDGVRFAESDYVMETSAVPNDPSFDQQWPFQNTGQTLNGSSGLAGADENVVPAWEVTTGSPAVVIGEVDSGVDYDHPDLAANVWSNPGGIGGCPAGTHGIDVVGDATTCDPMDDEVEFGGHGTHVAGILGAVGDNEIGVTGLNWATTIVPAKFVGADGRGTTHDLIEGLQWLLEVKQAGINIRVVNDSQTFRGTEYSQALSDEIDLLGAADILFVTAAGNSGEDNDDPSFRRYPCGYGRPNEICVTASNQRDEMPEFANYGDETVDLAAPGKNVYSTLRGGTYGFVSGGSMASPQVAGTAALILSTGYRSAVQLKAEILDNVDPLPALAGKVRTGGRLDVCAAIPACNPPPPGDPSTGSGGDPSSGDAGAVGGGTHCPNLNGGCPAVAVSVTLRYSRRHERFSGRLRPRTAPRACLASRGVTIWRHRHGRRDRRLARKRTKGNGTYRLKGRIRAGRYYATVGPKALSGVGRCNRTRSRRIRVR